MSAINDLYDKYNFIELEYSLDFIICLQTPVAACVRLMWNMEIAGENTIISHSHIQTSMYFVVEDIGKTKHDLLRMTMMDSLEPHFLHSSRFSRQ